MRIRKAKVTAIDRRRPVETTRTPPGVPVIVTPPDVSEPTPMQNAQGSRIAQRRGPQHRTVAAWSIAHAVNDGCMGAALAAIPSLIAYKGFDQQTITSVIAVGAILSSIGQPIAGLAIDRTKRAGLGALGLAASGIGLGMAFAGQETTGVVLAILLIHLGSCVFHPAAAYSIRRFADAGPRSTAVFATGGAVGFAVAPLLFSSQLVLTSWLVAALIATPALTIAALCLIVNHSSPVAATPMPPRSERRFRPNRMFLLAVASACLWSTIFLGINTFLPLTMHNWLDISLDEASRALGLFGAGGVLGSLAGGWIGGRIGLRSTMILAGCATAACTLSMSVVGDPRWMMGAAFALGAGLYLAYAPQLLIAMRSMPHHTAAVSAIILGSSTTIGSIFIPILDRLAEAFGLRATLVALVPVAMLLIAVATQMHDEARSPDKKSRP